MRAALLCIGLLALAAGFGSQQQQQRLLRQQGSNDAEGEQQYDQQYDQVDVYDNSEPRFNLAQEQIMDESVLGFEAARPAAKSGSAAAPAAKSGAAATAAKSAAASSATKPAAASSAKKPSSAGGKSAASASKGGKAGGKASGAQQAKQIDIDIEAQIEEVREKAIQRRAEAVQSEIKREHLEFERAARSRLERAEAAAINSGAAAAKGAPAQTSKGTPAQTSKGTPAQAGKGAGKGAASAAAGKAGGAKAKAGVSEKHGESPEDEAMAETRKELRASLRSGQTFAQFVAGHRSQLDALAKSLDGRYNSAAAGNMPQPSMTDYEMCVGCHLALSAVVEHTDVGSDHEDVVFALHSACHDQPPVMAETCTELVRLDSLIANSLLLTRDPGSVCTAVGICYTGLLDWKQKKTALQGVMSSLKGAASGGLKKLGLGL